MNIWIKKFFLIKLKGKRELSQILTIPSPLKFVGRSKQISQTSSDLYKSLSESRFLPIFQLKLSQHDKFVGKVFSSFYFAKGKVKVLADQSCLTLL